MEDVKVCVRPARPSLAARARIPAPAEERPAGDLLIDGHGDGSAGSFPSDPEPVPQRAFIAQVDARFREVGEHPLIVLTPHQQHRYGYAETRGIG